jgi:hypothetical protein
VTGRLVRWLKSYLHAPSRSRKGGTVITLTLTATALTIGVAGAYGFQNAYEASDRFETMTARAMQVAPLADATGVKRDATLGRVQVAEQIRLMRQANEVTRNYYEGHLQEMKWQRLQSATMPVAAPDRFLSTKR